MRGVSSGSGDDQQGALRSAVGPGDLRLRLDDGMWAMVVVVLGVVVALTIFGFLAYGAWLEEMEDDDL